MRGIRIRIVSVMIKSMRPKKYLEKYPRKVIKTNTTNVAVISRNGSTQGLERNNGSMKKKNKSLAGAPTFFTKKLTTVNVTPTGKRIIIPVMNALRIDLSTGCFC